MTAAAQIRPVAKAEKAKRLITLETYVRLYSNKSDGYRYEWNNGVVEKTTRKMNRSQLYIAKNLVRLFSKTKAYHEGGELDKEVIMFLPTANRNRIADLAYLTKEQFHETDDLKPSLSPFVIEIISKNDTSYELEKKLSQYFDNGVEVVWQILPQLQTIHVYTSPETVKICRGTTICSASPVLADFNIAAQDVFAL